MEKQDYKIHIIGAGISGLIAAQLLEDNGYAPVIIEASDRAGGRVKTDVLDGYQLDQGFQVLLTEYPAAKKYLDYKALNLQYIRPGASIFKSSKQLVIGDPLRDFSLLLPTLLSNIGTFSDKLKVLRLNKLLKNKSIDAIFASEETTTLAYLKAFGFSNVMIEDFFRPFFSGIFLENELETSSRSFEFIYKMFGEGSAAIPKSGIEAIPNQLKSRLKNTTFLFDTKIKQVKDHKIILENDSEFESHFTIIATEASKLIDNMTNQDMKWKSCDTLYFTTKTKTINKTLIGLVTDKNSLINNIFYHTSLEMVTQQDNELLSVTVVKPHKLSQNKLIETVKKELHTLCNITVDRFIKRYTIPMALPDIKNVHYDLSPTETKLTSSIFLAGDTLLNGSLNAAILSGEKAALGTIKTLEAGISNASIISEYQ